MNRESIVREPTSSHPGALGVVENVAPIADSTRRVFIAEPGRVPSHHREHLLKRCWRGCCGVVHWCFGFLSLIVILSVLATVPVLQFMSLGYLLDTTGRVVRSRKLRSGFIGIHKSARFGSVCVGIFLSLLPLRFASSMWYSSLLLNGESSSTSMLRLLVFALGAMAFWHICWATFRGGKLRHFLWPAPLRFWRRVREGGMYREASCRLVAVVDSLRLPYFFWLGVRGFIGASIWLFVPVSLMAVSTKAEDVGFGGLLAFVGGLLLAFVLLYLPFLQARLAVTQRFRGQFEVSVVRDQFKRAPIAYWISLLVTLLLALPLYLLKAELIPREAAWLPSLFFVAFMYPARLMVGWAVSRADKREQPRIWISRWLAKMGVLPITLIYAFIVYFTQFTSWYGSWSLYEQHAFLVPVPFLGY